jgi:carbamoyl-phosphate synthase large subunit
VFISVCDRDKDAAVELGRAFRNLGFRVLATPGTRKALVTAGVETDLVFKRGEGRPDVTDVIKNGEVHLVLNSPSDDPLTREDEKAIRTEALLRGVPTITTVFGARILETAIESMRRHGLKVRAMQDFHATVTATTD